MAHSVKNLIDQLKMTPHEEGGWFCPIPEIAAAKDPATGRAASGAIYYALLPGETADFHVIDCDEYWCHHAGDALEIWMVHPNGILTKQLVGEGENCSPLAWIPAGVAFAAKHLPGNSEGTLVSCITVPQFSYEGWQLLAPEQVCELCPDAKGFWT